MALEDWVGEGHCTKVDFSELDLVGEYHPEQSEYYRVESFIVKGRTSYISCRPSATWGGNASQFISGLKLYEHTEQIDNKSQTEKISQNFLLANSITDRDVEGWVLSEWRIDHDTMIVNGQEEKVFKDTLTWKKGDEVKHTSWHWIPKVK